MLNRKLTQNILLFATLALGTMLFLWHFQGALATWFLREDSRFFSMGPFSLYDLLEVFFRPTNSMGQYRPITKLLWGLVYWVGGLSPFFAHLISLCLLWFSGLLLARLHFLLFGQPFLSLLCGLFFLFIPANARAAYWISAWHNPALVLFFLAALVFRLEQWRRPKISSCFRGLTLLAAFFAIASREVAFGLFPLLFWIDYRQSRDWRKSIDVLSLGVFAFFFLFVFNTPLEQVGIKIDFFAWLKPWVFLPNFWSYGRAIFWSQSDALEGAYPIVSSLLSLLILLLIPIAPFLNRALAFVSVFALLAIFPFLLLPYRSIEYGSLFAAALLLLAGGGVSLLLRRASWRREVCALILGMSLFSLYVFHIGGSRRFFQTYRDESLTMQAFFSDLKKMDEQLPAYRRIYIRDFGFFRDSKANISHHFISPAMDEFLPGRIILFRVSDLGLLEGNSRKDPGDWIWRKRGVDSTPPLEVKYTEEGFVKW